MYITGSYLGASTEGYKCAFYMLYEDYVQTQMRFMQDLSLLLQRFARDLGQVAPLFVPFMDDITEVKNNVLEKQWSQSQLKEIRNTPGMLMIDVVFSIFKPQKNQWIYFYFNTEKDSLKEIEELLKNLALIINKGNCNLFKEVNKMRRKKVYQKVEKIVEIKPNIMGISIDIKEASKLIMELINQK